MNKGKGPERNHREGITVIQLAHKFPEEEMARVWIERIMWSNGRVCPRCKGTDTHESTHETFPYRCRPCSVSSVFAKERLWKTVDALSDLG